MIEQQLSAASFKEMSPFLGEVPVTALVNGTALASMISLTAGTAQHTNEPWLHFVDPVDGKTKYVAKKPYRSYISWDHINARSAVFGTRTIKINGKTYKVRLLKGSATDPHLGDGGVDTIGAYGSEWNRLLYPLIPNPSNRPASGISGEGIEYGSWADYTETELVLDVAAGSGRASWCQEKSPTSTSRVFRGNTGVSYLNMSMTSTALAPYGWRPVLELVD